MIRKECDRTCFAKQMFGAPGEVDFRQILNAGEFFDKGRLFNHCVLKPGMGLGKHGHTDEIEVYYIIKGEGRYDDNGTEAIVRPGDTTVCFSGEEHAIYNDGAEDLEFIALILFTK